MCIVDMNEKCRLLMNENHSTSYINTQVYLYEQQEYPRIAGELQNLIARKYNISAESVFLVNGIDEAIYLFCSWLKEMGSCLLYDIPNYCGLLDIVDLMSMPAIAYNQNQEKYDEKLLYLELERNPQVKAVYLCNPRNPSGNCISTIDSILQNHRLKKCVFFLDEAYAEFVEREYNYSANFLQCSRVIIARTFSKAYGLAGIRVGYIMTEEKAFKEYLEHFGKMQPYHLSIYSLKAAIEALRNEDRMYASVDNINKNRIRIFRAFEELDIHYYPSSTNFVTFIVDDVCQLLEYMSLNKLLIANLENFKMSNCARVSVGNDDETTLFINCLKKYYEERKI